MKEGEKQCGTNSIGHPDENLIVYSCVHTVVLYWCMLLIHSLFGSSVHRTIVLMDGLTVVVLLLLWRGNQSSGRRDEDEVEGHG